MIGAGGMSLVYHARDRRDQRSVAIKVLRPELALEPRVVRRFLREAHGMQRLAHPNILPVLDVPESPQPPYFVMPCIEPGSLALLIKSGQPLPAALALGLTRQIAAAVAHAHAAGVIHSDLKPGNVLVDAEERVYLSDFGLARALASDFTPGADHTPSAGTAPYMSPAVASGEAEYTRSDIYALGALLYEMLTGCPPYSGKTTAQILEQIRAGPPRRIQNLNGDASPGLVMIAEGAMARALRDRYSCVADVLVDLERVARQLTPLGPHSPKSRDTEVCPAL
jgi:serine/threonine-protein kinase